ncbi:MAG: hypothetical protein ABR913_05385 [Sedimentisphaerales bacterium]|jgi:hypothetical protein
MKKMFVAVSLMMKGKWSKGGTEMKNLLVLLVVFAIVSTASATLVTNGEFTINAAGWNATGGGSWGAEAPTVGGNPGGYVVLWTNLGAWSCWYQAGVEDLNTLGIPVGTDVILQADVNAIGTSRLTDASLKLESWGPSGKIEEWATPFTLAANNTWETHSTTTYTIPSNATSLKAVLVSIPTTAAGRYGFDNVEILVPGGTPALRPVPIVGAGKDPANKVISWTNPKGAVNADVYMMELTSPADYGVNPRAEGTLVAHNTTDQSVTVPSLQGNRYYYWMVDVNMGSSVIGGFIWDFQTMDAPPTVDAGPNQYLVATASPMTLTLNATASDDHGISTYAWTNITAAADKDPATVVTIVSPNTKNTTVTLTNSTGSVTGYYQFTLTVTDTAGQTTADSVVVGVYATCAAAAIANPDDTYDGVGDFNGDCKVDLYDFAIFVSKWLACDSLRRPCP